MGVLIYGSFHETSIVSRVIICLTIGNTIRSACYLGKDVCEIIFLVE